MSACNPGIYRVRQVLANRDVNCDEPSYILNDTNAVEVQVSPSFNVMTEMFENNVAKKSLTKTPNIPTTTSAELTFQALLKGSGDPTEVPALGIYLEGCGLDLKSLQKTTLTSVSGNFIVSETITSTNGSGKVAWYDSSTKSIWLTNITGTIANADVITGGTSLAVGTLSVALSVNGFAFTPKSDDFIPLTIRSEESNIICKETFGALGDFSLTADSSNPGQLEFTFTGRLGNYLKVETSAPLVTAVAGTAIDWVTGNGVVKVDYTSADPYLIYELSSGLEIVATDVITYGANTVTASGPSISTIDECPMQTVQYDLTTPPILQCSDLCMTSTFCPIVQNISFALGNEVVMRQNLNSCDGYAPAYISNRAPTFSFNPEVVSPSEYDFYKSWQTGALVNGPSVRWGNTAGNTIILWMDKLQIQSIADGDRDGIAILDIESMVTSQVDNGEFMLIFL